MAISQKGSNVVHEDIPFGKTVRIKIRRPVRVEFFVQLTSRKVVPQEFDMHICLDS